MKRKRFSVEQIAAIVKQGEMGMPPHGCGDLRLAGGPEFMGRRPIVLVAGWKAEVTGGFVDSIDAATKLASMSGLDLDKLFEQAQPRDFKPIELPVLGQD